MPNYIIKTQSMAQYRQIPSVESLKAIADASEDEQDDYIDSLLISTLNERAVHIFGLRLNELDPSEFKKRMQNALQFRKRQIKEDGLFQEKMRQKLNQRYKQMFNETETKCKQQSIDSQQKRERQRRQREISLKKSDQLQKGSKAANSLLNGFKLQNEKYNLERKQSSSKTGYFSRFVELMTTCFNNLGLAYPPEGQQKQVHPSQSSETEENQLLLAQNKSQMQIINSSIRAMNSSIRARIDNKFE